MIAGEFLPVLQWALAAGVFFLFVLLWGLFFYSDSRRPLNNDDVAIWRESNARIRQDLLDELKRHPDPRQAVLSCAKRLSTCEHQGTETVKLARLIRSRLEDDAALQLASSCEVSTAYATAFLALVGNYSQVFQKNLSKLVDRICEEAANELRKDTQEYANLLNRIRSEFGALEEEIPVVRMLPPSTSKDNGRVGSDTGGSRHEDEAESVQKAIKYGARAVEDRREEYERAIRELSSFTEEMRRKLVPALDDAIAQADQETMSEEVLSQANIAIIEPSPGEASDPEVHEEIASGAATEQVPIGHVLRMAQRGYKWTGIVLDEPKEIVLRKARVVVAVAAGQANQDQE